MRRLDAVPSHERPTAAVRLRSAILCVEHDGYGAIAPHAIGKCFHACQWICQVMENAGRYHEIEVEPQRWQLFDRQPMQLQVLQPVLVFEILLMVQ